MFRPLLAWLDDALNETVVLGYDKIGFYARKPLWNPADMAVSMEGRICLITGANSGLGFATSMALAEKGATVYMACRSQSKGEAARDAIIKATGNGRVYLEMVDIGNQNSVRHFVEQFQAREKRLHVLINNAGALINERKLSADGIELSLATNLLGSYLLTNLLLPMLRNSAPARVINVSSGGLYLAKLNLEDLQWQQRTYNGAMAYAENKRALVYLTELWAKELLDTGVTVNSMHPGWADTPGVQESLPGFRALTQWSLRNSEEGADTMIWLAVNPHLKQTGQFWFDRKARTTHRLPATHSTLQELEQLWELCGRLTGCEKDFPGWGGRGDS